MSRRVSAKTDTRLTGRFTHRRRTVRPDDFVVVKMDIEGAEFFTLPHAINSGALCTGVDYLSAEFHEFLARHTPLSFPDHGVELPTQQAAETLRDSLRRTIRGLPAHCRLHNVDNMDDEAYLNDRSHAQLEAPSVRA